MLRISKLTDYGTVIMAYLAKHPHQAYTAKIIAQHTQIALPTVSKLLKRLAQQKLLLAQRGAKGGYSLAMAPTEINLAQIIFAIEGEIALTECGHHPGLCSVEPACAIRHNWRTITEAVRHTLNEISLAAMIKPINPIRLSKDIKQRLPISSLRS